MASVGFREKATSILLRTFAQIHIAAKSSADSPLHKSRLLRGHSHEVCNLGFRQCSAVYPHVVGRAVEKG